MTVPGPPEPLAPVAGLVDNLGNQVLDTAISLAPVAVPFVLVMTSITWVMRKFGLSSGAGLSAGGVETYSERDGGRCRSCRGHVEPGEGTLCEDCRYYADEEQRSMS